MSQPSTTHPAGPKLGHSDDPTPRPDAQEPDLETTNWNAVKLLASKHGIHLRSYEEEREERRQHRVDQQLESPSVDSDPTEITDVDTDLGVGTPFRITARHVQNGRVIYTFKWRGPDVAAAAAKDGIRSTSAGSGVRIPSSSSHGSMSGISNSDAEDDFNPPFHPDASKSSGKKSNFMSLAASRSIPALRSKPSNGLLKALGGSVLATPTASRHASIQPSASESFSSSPQRPNHHQSVRVVSGKARESLPRHEPQPASGTPPSQPSLQGGDVLGAILGLPHDAVTSPTTQLPPSFLPPSQTVPTIRSFGRTIAVRRGPVRAPPSPIHWDHSPIPQVQNVGEPLFDDLSAFAGSAGASSPTMPPEAAPALREMQSFDSAASTQTTRPDPEATNGQAGSRDDESEHATLMFDVFQMYQTSSRRLSTDPHLAASPAESGRRATQRPHSRASSVDTASNGPGPSAAPSAHATSTSAAPGDDPRFVLWAVRDPVDDEKLILSDRQSAHPEQTTQGTPDHAAPSSTRRWSSRIASQPDASPSSHTSRSSRSKTNGSTNRPVSVSVSANYRSFIIAATPTRLVAELTSEIDNRLMTDFFYTFREYMTPGQLLRLLISRFEWAMAAPQSPEDEARRRIVRVRTYVIIKYWLTNFFDIDFLPNRELRNALTSWLNGIDSDPELPHRPADLSIIKSLKKVVRSLKHSYEESGVSGLLRGQPGDQDSVGSTASASGAHDESRPATARSSASGTAHIAGTEPHVGSSGNRPAASSAIPSTPSQRSEGAFPREQGERSPSMGNNALHAGGSASAPPPLPSSYSAFSRALVNTVGRLARMKRTLGNKSNIGATSADSSGLEAFEFEANELGDLLYVRGGVENFIKYFHGEESVSEDDGGGAVSDDAFVNEETPSLSASSRVSTSTPASSVADMSLEAPEQADATKSSLGLGIDAVPAEAGAEGGEANESHAVPVLLPPASIHEEGADGDQEVLDAAGLPGLSDDGRQLKTEHATVHHAVSDRTLRSAASEQTENGLQAANRPLEAIIRQSSSSQRLRRRRSTQSYRSTTGPNIVQIDDIDLSSDEDDGVVQRALRRLPGARDLRMANNMQDIRPMRQSFDSMSSFGRVYSERDRNSVGTSGSSIFPPRDRHLEPPRDITQVHTELLDPDEALAGYELVKGFRIEDFASDDEGNEPGDVEEALRRLEGFIDEDKKAERARRVETLWEQSRARRALEERGRLSGTTESTQEEEDEESGVLGAPSVRDSTGQASETQPEEQQERRSLTVAPQRSSVSTSGGRADTPPLARLRKEYDQQRSIWPPARLGHAGGDTNDAPPPPTRLVAAPPVRVLAGDDTKMSQSHDRSDKAASLSATRESAIAAPVIMARQQEELRRRQARGRTPTPAMALGSPWGTTPHPPVHRCFLLNYKTDVIARQFTLIECELFKSVDWSELVSDRWRERRYKDEVLDWEAFYQERVRARAVAEAEGLPYRETAVEGIIARFNLTCNWVASEVILTRNIDERVAVISKLIRIAFKCYQQMNFATLVQICFGLQTPWVERLRKTWSKVGLWEMRIFRDLKALTTPRGNFRPLRNAMQEMVVDGRLEDLITSTGPPQPRRGGGSAANTGRPGESIGVRMMDRCVPFFGLFISELASADALPSFVDPTSPNSAADLAPAPSPAPRDAPPRLAKLANPAAFSALPPLPAGLELQPMINLYKYRSVATIVKTVLAFQAKAANYTFHADAGVYVKCLKIRCLNGHQMTQISEIAEI